MLALFYNLKGKIYGRFLLFLLCLIAVMPFVTHYYLTRRSGTQVVYPNTFHGGSTEEGDVEDLEYRLYELRRHINELEHVKLSLKNELRELESKRHGLLRDIHDHTNNLESIRNKETDLKNAVQKRKQELEVLHFAKQMVNNCPQLPHVKPPKDILSKLSNSFKTYPKASLIERKHCSLSSCFSFQRCPYGEDFTAHVYKPHILGLLAVGGSSKEIYNILKSMPYAVDVHEPTACVYIVIIDTILDIAPKALENILHNLRFWQGDGHNHIIMNFARPNRLATVDTGRAIIAQTTFGPRAPYRHEFDIVIPPLVSMTKSGPAWENSVPQLPANRKYLLSFLGNYHNSGKVSTNDSFISALDLKQLSSEAKNIYIQLSCQVDKEFSSYNDWQLCSSHNERAKVLKASTFALIIQFGDDQTMTLVRLMEALQYGSIPVLMLDNVLLPYSDIIDWHRAAIILRSAQFPQLHFILQTILVNDLLDIRRQGRFLWETYFSTTKTVLESTIAAVQTRLSLPSIPAKDTKIPLVFTEENEPMFYRSDLNRLFPHRIKSPTFYRNFTSNTIYARQRWNNYPGALLLYPSSPFVPVLPSSAAFLNSSGYMQPIGNGVGGAGFEFQKALGGDYLFEQFTIVMLTYKREMVLLEALSRLAGLQYLNKVIVVWNSPDDSPSELNWPNVGVPVKVHGHKTSSFLLITMLLYF